MENIISSLKNLSNMSDEAVSEITSHLEPLNISRKKVLTSSLAKDQNIYFIEKGIARLYNHMNGKEFTIWFSKEGELIYCTDNFYGKKMNFESEYVQVLEESLVYVMSIKDLKALYETNIEVANWFRAFHEEIFLEIKRRLISRLSQSAAERYEDLIVQKPYLFQRVNLGYIASYLGISHVTLCALRNRKI